jgi:hypothetical protein
MGCPVELKATTGTLIDRRVLSTVISGAMFFEQIFGEILSSERHNLRAGRKYGT